MEDGEELYECYGVVVPERKFHVSSLCPCIKNIAGWKRAEISAYRKEADAVIMGHTHRCPICFNMYRFRLRVAGTGREILIDKYDLDVLLGIAKLYRQGQSITVTSICEHAKMGFGETNDTIKRLKRLGLVRASEWLGGKEIRGKRKFTPLGKALVLAYEAGIYGAPLNSPTEKEYLEPNTKLI